MWQVLQSMTVISKCYRDVLQSVTGITKCDICTKWDMESDNSEIWTLLKNEQTYLNKF